jgi:zinc transport system substrate-binding protein
MIVMTRIRLRRVTAASLVVATAVALAGCGSSSAGKSDDGRLHVVASFYPLQYAAQRVAGNLADVTSLTKPGAEPHDLELTPREVGNVETADLVVYLSGFQPAVDDAVANEAGHHAFDVKPAAHLDLSYTPIEEGETADSDTTDPHFWLDPTRLGSVARALADRLTELDPAHADDFAANATAFDAELSTLDTELHDGLATCQNKDLVTSHNAFGYLAHRYGLAQVGITGLTPEDEPSPHDLAEVTHFVRSHDVRTIYYETLVSPAIAETVARETGATTAVLDPIEGLDAESAGSSYLDVMRSNLASLRKGQPCP